ncbi:hypothetical protein PC114_g21135 [Phytophthora cactorum]|nr:hypothetical protein PC114_g21135 [Phytophthora cactorum]KAG3033719.1 hypothetical protein PC121_g24333 [Phytophthora cactorum]KAG3062357.1 hypothetical protein PC122_g19322 [Phytophthora cactorum]KAG3136432.1 hypothetical protein C6341_g21387 [Phytophthora cactorum]KAG3190382.1 hypothetical protein PC128_g11354 [Phytophthora cactorum]
MLFLVQVGALPVWWRYPMTQTQYVVKSATRASQGQRRPNVGGCPIQTRHVLQVHVSFHVIHFHILI